MKRDRPIVIVVAGVAGVGKSTIGMRLASREGASFLDADDLHPPSNIAKMRAGTSLGDMDRAPWLQRIGERITEAVEQRRPLVVACSALKRSYRRVLHPSGDDSVLFIMLTGSRDLVAERLAGRTGHFMRPSLLGAQMETLQLPAEDENAWIIDVQGEPRLIVDAIVSRLHQP